MKPEETAENEPEESASKTSELVESSSQAASESAQNSQTSVAMVDSEKPKKKEKLIKNQFNYQDRGTQSGKFSSHHLITKLNSHRISRPAAKAKINSN